MIEEDRGVKTPLFSLHITSFNLILIKTHVYTLACSKERKLKFLQE